jgi:hypothetical protein
MTVTEQDERFELISAFADGERVDTEALREALAEEAGRDFFIDMIAMREVVSGGVMTAGAAGSPAAAPPRGRRVLGLAAAALVAVGVGGYAIGHQQSRIVTVAAHPPLEADAVVSMEAAPAPTQVIRLDGTTRGGGR